MFNRVHASQHVPTAQGFLESINQAILYPLIALMMAAALVVFLYGAFEFVRGASEPAQREAGRRHLIYGVIGMLVMLMAFTILQIAANTFDGVGELDGGRGESVLDLQR